MISIREAFPLFHGSCHENTDERFSHGYDLDNPATRKSILDLILDQENGAQQSGRAILPLAEALFQDIISAKAIANDGDHVTFLNYLQFFSGGSVMLTGAASSRFDLIYEGISMSLSDEPLGETQREFMTGRLIDFFTSTDPVIKSTSIQFALEWFRALYYYCRRHGGLGLNGMAIDLYDLAKKRCISDLPSDEAITALAHILTWSHAWGQGIDERLIDLLFKIEKNGNYSGQF